MIPDVGAVEDMLWSGWGRPERHEPLSASLRSLLQQSLGISGRSVPAVGFDEVQLDPSTLSRRVRGVLAAVVGDAHVLDDRRSRILHCAGKSTVDLLRLRRGDARSAPDGVVLPSSHGEVLAVLRVCAEHAIAVVPFGGGTSVVGGLGSLHGAHAALVALDLRRMDRVVAVDSISLTATLEPGLRAPRAEQTLAARGLTLGHFPQSFEHASVGGFAATRSSGQASSGYGRFDEMVTRLRVATPEGELDLGRAPASAAGPDLRQLFLGSEGALGVITELTVRVRRSSAARRYEGWRMPGFEPGVAALRRCAQVGAVPTVVRLSDETETAITAALARDDGGSAHDRGCLMIAGFEGESRAVDASRAAVAEILVAEGGSPLGPGPGEAWLRDRFAGPYMRDALLDAGVITETLETATSWSNLARLHTDLSHALQQELSGQGTPPLVMSHVSHLYPTGASLYVTVVAACATDPISQWRRAKRAANDAIATAGATISHHHGVGTEHRDWMPAEVGDLGVEILRAVKRRVDPRGILNPGKLIPV